MKTIVPIICWTVLTTILPSVLCHSWIACTDYTKKNAYVYDARKCRGFPRAANLRIPRTKAFGKDAGFVARPKETKPCQASRNDTAFYDRKHPMAVYYPGQQVVLAHPMKNHGADKKCTNIYIPDHGSFIYRGKQNATSDSRLSEFKRNLVFDLGRSPVGVNNTRSSVYPKPGFQNAPALCDHTKGSMDRALGTYSFNVPSDLKPGRYTFIWIWAFNGPHETYSTCFEVDIVKNLQERNRRLRKNGFSDLSEPCGGVTSNPNIKGKCNQQRSKFKPRKTNISPPPKRPLRPKLQKIDRKENKIRWCRCPCRG